MPGGSGLRNVVSRLTSGRKKHNDNPTSGNTGTSDVHTANKPSSPSSVPTADTAATPLGVATRAGVAPPPAKSKAEESVHLTTQPKAPRQTYFPVPILPATVETPPEPVVCQCCDGFFHWVQATDRGAESSGSALGSPGRFFHYSRYEEWEGGLAKGCPLCSFLRSICFTAVQQILGERKQPILTWIADARANDGSPLPDESVRANVTTETEPLHGRLGLSLQFIRIGPEQGTILCTLQAEDLLIRY